MAVLSWGESIVAYNNYLHILWILSIADCWSESFRLLGCSSISNEEVQVIILQPEERKEFAICLDGSSIQMRFERTRWRKNGQSNHNLHFCMNGCQRSPYSGNPPGWKNLTHTHLEIAAHNPMDLRGRKRWTSSLVDFLFPQLEIANRLSKTISEDAHILNSMEGFRSNVRNFWNNVRPFGTPKKSASDPQQTRTVVGKTQLRG